MHRKAVPLTVGDRTFNLRFTVNAICRFEERTGKNIIQVFDELTGGKVSFADIRLLMWTALIHEKPDLTDADAGDIMDEAGFQQMADLLGQALNKAFETPEAPQAAGGAAGNPQGPAAIAGTGSSSPGSAPVSTTTGSAT